MLGDERFGDLRALVHMPQPLMDVGDLLQRLDPQRPTVVLAFLLEPRGNRDVELERGLVAVDPRHQGGLLIERLCRAQPPLAPALVVFANDS